MAYITLNNFQVAEDQAEGFRVLGPVDIHAIAKHGLTP